MARTPPVFVVDAPAIASASDPTLEQQLRDAPEDEAVAQVYADWLIERGDPRGELAMAQLRGDKAREEAAGARPARAQGEWVDEMIDGVSLALSILCGMRPPKEPWDPN